MKNDIENIKALIGQNKMTDAINSLKLIDSYNANEIFFIENRLKELNRKINRGIISNENSEVIRNQIVNSLLDLISVNFETDNKHLTDNSSKVVEKSLVLHMVSELKKSIRFYMFVAFIPITISVIFFLWSLLSDDLGMIQTLGSLLIGSLSGFPIKEIINRMDKISVLNLLVIRIETLISSPNNREEIDKVNSIFWNMLENTLIKT